MQLDEHLLAAVSIAVRVPVLALVPLFTGLSRWSDVVATATREGQRVSVHFGFPYPPADLWTFASPPPTGIRGEVVPLSLVLNIGLPGVVLVAAAASLLGLVLTTFAVLFTRDLVGLAPGPTADGRDTAGPSAR